MAPKAERVRRAIVSVQGDRGFPLAEVKIPEFAVGDVTSLLLEAQVVHPATSMDDLVRALWRSGLRSVRNQVRQGRRLAATDDQERLAEARAANPKPVTRGAGLVRGGYR